MDTAVIRTLSRTVDTARAELAALKSEAASLTCSGHQNTAVLTVNGRRIQLIAIGDGRVSYRAVEVRGVEMVLLGVKKWYAARIEAQRIAVANAERELREAAEKGG